MWDDLKNLGITLLVLTVLVMCIFTNSSYLFNLKACLYFILIFVLPGYFILQGRPFVERLILGTILSLVIVGTLSYYLGLIGLHIKYHLVIPILITFIGFCVEYIKRGEKE